MRLFRWTALPVVMGPLAFTAAPALAQTSAPATAAKEPITRIVVFGDSLADGGYYLPVSPATPRDAGSFTTNPDPVAPEVLAARLGLDLLPAYGANGTNFAVGGARVTAANAASIPVATQISRWLAANPRFAAGDLVYVQGGGNDYFAFQALGSRDNTILTTAANQLAQQVVALKAAGAPRLVTLAIQTGGSAGLQLFNQTYAAALRAANVNALYFDTDKLFNEIVASAPAFGITNVTGVACTVPSSLNCNRSTLVSPNANETYILADSVHPTGVVDRIQGQAIASLVGASEQIAGLRYAAQSMFRGQRDLIEGPMRGGAARDGRALALWGAGAYHYYNTGASQQRIGITERGFSGVAGLDYALGERSGIGVAGGYVDGSGDFSAGAGDYRVKGWTATGYLRAGVGPFRLLADGTYGDLSYDRISRRVQLGLVNRTMRGDTDGDYAAGRLTAAVDLFSMGGVGIGPDLSAQYERVRIDGYAERGTSSTDASFGNQRLQSWTGRASLVARTLPGSPVGFFARAGYEREFDDDPRLFTLTPAGAPVSYTTDIARADRNYTSYAMAIDGRIAGALSIRAGVNGTVLRDDRDSVTAFAGLSTAF
jgi:outer membrane lipase/esterase